MIPFCGNLSVDPALMLVEYFNEVLILYSESFKQGTL